MLSLKNILTVSKYEMKTLWRSWFFRIFSILAIAIIILLSIGLHTNVGRTPWFFKGMTSSIPYMNILLLNIAQAIIGVFLASEFLKRDKKLDTTEVIYMRSMTNGDYVIGKTLGILLVFLGLNIVALLVSVVFNVFFSSVGFNIIPYLLYPLVISMPTLMFIFGLSFLFMVVIRNQAVTFILLLGYIAVTLFFLSSKLHYIFDYMAFNVPLMYSDFVGFGNLDMILLHRGIYFLLGVGFIFATIFLIKRLPQSTMMTKFSMVFSAICVIAAIFLGTRYLSHFSSGRELRNEMKQLNEKFAYHQKVTPLEWNILLNHQKEKINIEARLAFQNSSESAIDKYIFSLNPGLAVKNVTSNGEKIGFGRKHHIITVKPSAPLQSGSIDSLTIEYGGNINEQALYLDIDDEDREQLYRLWIYNIAKRFAFVQPDFVLLTPEVNWYPVAGVPYGSVFPPKTGKDFFNFKLTVNTRKNLEVISQGEKEKIGEGQFTFSPENPLPQYSLIIGNFQERKIVVDSVEYSLYNLEGHDYYEPYFTDIGDTLAPLIRELKQDYENKLKLTYPFNQFSIVEVPIQFFYYQRLWTVSVETVQPEMVFASEKGLLMNGADFEQMSHWQERRADRSNQTITPEESQSQIFSQFVRMSLLNASFRRFMPDEIMSIEPNYHIFPNYYTFTNHFNSKDWPIFNVSLESYLNSRTEEPASPFSRFFRGLSDEEKANIALMEESLSEILNAPAEEENLSEILKQKGSYLFQLIQSKVAENRFDKFVVDILNSNRFQDVKVQRFIDELYQITEFDLEPHFDTWYNSSYLPGFLVSDIKAYKVLDEDRTRFQVRFKIQNQSEVEGLASVTYRMGGRRRFFGGGSGEDPPEQVVSLLAGQTKEIGMVLDDNPRVLIINTLISKNLPNVIQQRFEELELNEKATPFAGERVLDESITLVQQGEIIVDNEDSGFKVLYQPQKNALKKLLQGDGDEDEEKYIGFNFWRPPSQWKLTTADEFYGKFIHSAHYIKSGKGEKKVAWTVEVEDSGTYDIYYYSSDIRTPWMRRRGRDRQYVEQFHFIIYHDDGTEELAMNVRDAENGWNFLGTYYLTEGEVRVEMTDESKGRVVYADAVKWVKH